MPELFFSLLHISRTKGKDIEEREHEMCFRYVHSSPVGKIAECNEKKGEILTRGKKLDVYNNKRK